MFSKEKNHNAKMEARRVQFYAVGGGGVKREMANNWLGLNIFYCINMYKWFEHNSSFVLLGSYQNFKTVCELF